MTPNASNVDDDKKMKAIGKSDVLEIQVGYAIEHLFDI